VGEVDGKGNAKRHGKSLAKRQLNNGLLFKNLCFVSLGICCYCYLNLHYSLLSL